MIIDDFSFGIIPFHKESNRFLLIKHLKDHWSFPKGHPEAQERPQEAALRELYEETGIQVTNTEDKPFYETYTFIKNNMSVNKKVTYFLGFVQDTDVTIQEKEISDFAWLTYEDALSTITFENSQYVLKEAFAYLKLNNKI